MKLGNSIPELIRDECELPFAQWFGTNNESDDAINFSAFPTNVSARQMGNIQQDVQALRHETRSEIAKLSAAIEVLTRAVSSMQANLPATDASFSESSQFFILPEPTPDAQFLEILADSDEGWSIGWQQAAYEALNDDAPSLRVAAARALAAHAPKESLDKLTERMSVEKNRYVRAVLEGTIEAAKL